MCTSVSFNGQFHGRNLDLEYEIEGTKVIVTPIGFEFKWRCNNETTKNQYAMIGMGMIKNNYPLYYEAANEHGLYCAGLNFPGIADFKERQEGKNNVTPFELVPYLLSQCKTIAEVKKFTKNMNLVNEPFDDHLKLSPLHWIVSDSNKSIIIEQTKKGFIVYDRKVMGVLTNNPSYCFHKMNLNNYIGLSPDNQTTSFSRKIGFEANLSNGLGTIGLPGGLDSMSRFIRATYTKTMATTSNNEIKNVTQFFHILNSVNQTEGTVKGHKNKLEKTFYACCYSTKSQSYFYRTYYNNQLTCIKLTDELKYAKKLTSFKLRLKQNIMYEN